MQEIVPPKLNKDTGLLSLLVNRRNIIIAIGFVASFLLWSGFPQFSTDQKFVIELLIGGSLVPLLIDVHGRAMHRFVIDAFSYYLNSKKQRTILAKDISEGVLISPDGTYSQVYRIEPINLSMSSEEEINAFKTYIQQALFSLKTPIQVLTLQRYSFNDKNLDVEIKRVKKLTGTLQKRGKEYLDEYINLNQTMERTFYLIYTVTAHDLESAKRKLEDQQTFIKLLETTKVKLIPLETHEILELADYILPKQH